MKGIKSGICGLVALAKYLGYAEFHRNKIYSVFQFSYWQAVVSTVHCPVDTLTGKD